jgi:hypothetical protein
MFSIAGFAYVIVLVTVASLSEQLPFDEQAGKELLHTTLDQWSTVVQLTANHPGNGDNTKSADDADNVANPPLLPPAFQARVFFAENSRPLQAVQVYYDYVNQRTAAYGFSYGNSTRSQILLCKSRILYTFNATWCQPSSVPQCIINRSFLPPEARYAASFVLGQAAGGVPVQLWTVGYPPIEYNVLLQQRTYAPVQTVSYDDNGGGAGIGYYTDIKLTVDSSAFYVPKQCKPRFDFDAADPALRFLSG